MLDEGIGGDTMLGEGIGGDTMSEEEEFAEIAFGRVAIGRDTGFGAETGNLEPPPVDILAVERFLTRNVGLESVLLFLLLAVSFLELTPLASSGISFKLDDFAADFFNLAFFSFFFVFNFSNFVSAPPVGESLGEGLTI